MHDQAEKTPAPPPPDPGAARPVPWWHLHRRLYDWVLSLAHHRCASLYLFLLSFAESSFFPIPPDVLQIALTVERREKAWWFAGVSTAASVLGGVAGYAIGLWGWVALGPFFLEHVPGFTQEHFDTVQGWYAAYGFLAILVAAFTPIPYKVFTITAGVFGLPIWVLVVGSLLGRAGRFYLVAAIIWKFGPPAKQFVERYFNLLTLAAMVLLIAAIAFIKLTSEPHTPPAAAPPTGGQIESPAG